MASHVLGKAVYHQAASPALSFLLFLEVGSQYVAQLCLSCLGGCNQRPEPPGPEGGRHFKNY